MKDNRILLTTLVTIFAIPGFFVGFFLCFFVYSLILFIFRVSNAPFLALVPGLLVSIAVPFLVYSAIIYKIWRHKILRPKKSKSRGRKR